VLRLAGEARRKLADAARLALTARPRPPPRLGPA
jgi:hypothetical protein